MKRMLCGVFAVVLGVVCMYWIALLLDLTNLTYVFKYSIGEMNTYGTNYNLIFIQWLLLVGCGCVLTYYLDKMINKGLKVS